MTTLPLAYYRLHKTLEETDASQFCQVGSESIIILLLNKEEKWNGSTKKKNGMAVAWSVLLMPKWARDLQFSFLVSMDPPGSNLNGWKQWFRNSLPLPFPVI